MTTQRLDAHMEHPAVVDAQTAFDAHVLGCEVCTAATRQRNACETGQRLHDAVVRAAQAAYREVNPEAFAPEPHD